VDGNQIFFDPVTGYQIFIKGEYSYCKFVFRHSGEVRKMHIDVAREIYTALLEQGFAKTDYSPHIEMVQDEFCARDDANSSQGYNYAIRIGSRTLRSGSRTLRSSLRIGTATTTQRRERATPWNLRNS
jgi:hypothetical protein